MVIFMKRLPRLGGTDAAALYSYYNPDKHTVKWKNVSDVWLRLLTGKESKAGAEAQRGLRLEPELRELYRRTVGPVSGAMPSCACPKRRWAACSPDGIGRYGEHECLVEFKTQGKWSRNVWEAKGNPWSGRDIIPFHYYLQVQWNMSVMELERTVFMLSTGEDLIGSDGERVWKPYATSMYFANHDSELTAELHRLGEKFWVEHIETRKPPLLPDGEVLRPLGQVQMSFKTLLKKLQKEINGDDGSETEVAVCEIG